MSSRNYRVRNTYLCKYLKTHVSVRPRTVNMVKGPKQCYNLRASSFINLVDYSGKSSVVNSLC